jgi:hypothetical protein
VQLLVQVLLRASPQSPVMAKAPSRPRSEWALLPGPRLQSARALRRALVMVAQASPPRALRPMRRA